MVRPRSGGETGGEAFTDVVGCAVADVGAEVASIARAFPFRMRGAGNRTVIFSLKKMESYRRRVGECHPGECVGYR